LGRGLDGATAASGLQALQLALPAGIGALQAALRAPQTVEERDLVCGAQVLAEDIDLAYFEARQFPLRDGHLLQIELLGPGAGLPFGFQIVTKAMEFLAVLGGQDDGAGAKAVTERVHDGCHMFFVFRTLKAKFPARDSYCCFHDSLRDGGVEGMGI
jgi:hypothetical protein